MKITIAEDEMTSRTRLEAHLQRWGYDVESFDDGAKAFAAIVKAKVPVIGILDWVMPGMDGPEICHRVKDDPTLAPSYLIILTSREGSKSIVEGLKSGADDYVVKPFDGPVLRARVEVAVRVLELQSKLARRVQELEQALANVKRLQGLLPICAYCKRVRSDGNYWQQVDAYISEHTDARLSHGCCPDCYEHHVKPQLDEIEETFERHV